MLYINTSPSNESSYWPIYSEIRVQVTILISLDSFTP